MLLATMAKTISLTQLLSTCMDASRQGCEIIQKFHRAGAVAGTLKEGGNIKSVVTQADIDAQARIVGGLRQSWGGDLQIIGEEDEAEAVPNMDGPPLSTTLLDGKDGIFDDELLLDEVALFVDPLDGTREFVEGRLHNVGCLIGITQRNRPIAGVIGLPFPEGKLDTPVRVHYAITDQRGSAGCWPSESTTSKPAADDTAVTILTGDSNDPVLINATSLATSLSDNPNHVIIGGAAAKLRAVASDSNTLAILHFKTELWDTCSPQPLIESRGGKVTDLFGSPLVHSTTRPFGNIFGVIASSGGKTMSKLHEQMCAEMRADLKTVHRVFSKWMGPTAPSSPQAMDIARDLDGLPLSVEQVEKSVIGVDSCSGTKLKSWAMPESGAWRGLMSTGGRIHLEWDGDDASTLGLPSTVFYKRVVMADLAYARDKLTKAPHKLARDVNSCLVETSFLTSKACESLATETNLVINKVLASDLRPVEKGLGPREQLESRFALFLRDLNPAEGWEHQWLLNEEAARASLATLARMHGYFWTGSNFWKKDGGAQGVELENVVWPNGGYMQPKLQGLEQLKQVASGFAEKFSAFKDGLEGIPELHGVNLTSIGERLQEVAPVVGDRAHPFSSDSCEAYTSYRTLIHGDPKQANLFFRPSDDGLEVGLIDFQWCGFGLAATDVAHLLASAVLPSCLSHDGLKEKAHLDYYHGCLSKTLVEFGVAVSEEQVESDIFPRAVLQDQYETALLDVCRMVFASAWTRWKLETQPTGDSMNRNAYNKSLKSSQWLITRCHTLLEARASDFAGH